LTLRRRTTHIVESMNAHVPAAPLLASLLMFCALGCRTDLGECDEPAARQIVFLDTGSPADPRQGIPMFAGQALVVTSCGADRFCHASNPDLAPEFRYGAPAGLSFDVSLACLDRERCPADSPGVERLMNDQQRVFEYARSILSSVRSGWMPPSGVGSSLPEEHFGRLIDVGTRLTLEEGEQIPALGTREGDEILRNWLACGAPVVESTALPTGGRPGDQCSGDSAGTVGVCRRRVFVPQPPEPRWSSIYESVIFPMCGVACHGLGTPSFVEESQLDLSNAELAYNSIVGVQAAGYACAGQGILVDPGNSAGSLFIDKLYPNPICGDPMPSLGVTLDEDVIAAIAQWIDDGALND
jgi:hypothetical protein